MEMTENDYKLIENKLNFTDFIPDAHEFLSNLINPKTKIFKTNNQVIIQINYL